MAPPKPSTTLKNFNFNSESLELEKPVIQMEEIQKMRKQSTIRNAPFAIGLLGNKIKDDVMKGILDEKRKEAYIDIEFDNPVKK